MVEFICLVDIDGLQTMPRYCHVFKPRLFSPSQAKAVFVTRTLNYSAYEEILLSAW